MSSPKIWNVTLAGECMVCRPFSMHDEPAFQSVVDLLRDSDVTYAHFEMNLGDYEELDWPARGDSFGSYMMADPEIAEELRWAGVEMMSLAHNHSLDFGASGLLSTMRHCRQAGIAVAGTGRDLEEAREPAYFESRKGRVALVSVSSGNKSHEWAGLPKGSLRGRPGINPLRLYIRYVLDHESAEQFKAVASRLNVLLTNREITGKGLADGEFGIMIPGEQSTSGSHAFMEGDECGILSYCHRRDLEGNLRSIDEARTMADLVIVAHHFNVSDGKRGDVPPQFVKEFARAAIDGGADIFVAHGWHRTLGIEIYKGKPIIYGTGNFFAQTEFIRRVPYDSYEAWGHDVDRLPTLTPAAFPLHPGMDKPVGTWWSSAVIQLEMEGRQLRRMKLHPVEMGRDSDADVTLTRRTGSGAHAFTEGRPFLARGENGVRILERLRRLSADYGTKIGIRDGVGVIDL